MCNLKKLNFLALLLLSLAGQANAQSYAYDTVWTKNTDQSEGFYKVQFSDNDSIIVGFGFNDNLFFDANTGAEIHRIPGNKEGFFFNNDRHYLKLAENKTKLEIFDTNTFIVIDSLENDGSIIGTMNISNDRKYFISTINDGSGIRVWDLNLRKIIKNKFFEKDNDPNLGVTKRIKVFFNCDDLQCIVTTEKQYKGIKNDSYYITYHAILDINTLDSIDAISDVPFYRLSQTCRYIAYLTGDPTYGVEVYDFNTKELLWKIPVNGPSLTGIEFSPDDKYLVNSPGIKIWDIEKKELIKSYQSGSTNCFSISHDGQYFISSVGRYFYKWYARWNGTTIEDNPQNPIIIYPNPTNGMVTLSFEQLASEITTINLHDLNGIFIRNLFNNFLEPGPQNLNFNVSDLANGAYFINVSNSHLSLVFKLIVNR